jgi:hypothetical protein
LETKTDPQIDTESGPKIDTESGPKIDTESGPKMEKEDTKLETKTDPQIDTETGTKMEKEEDTKLETDKRRLGLKFHLNNLPVIPELNCDRPPPKDQKELDEEYVKDTEDVAELWLYFHTTDPDLKGLFISKLFEYLNQPLVDKHVYYVIYDGDNGLLKSSLFLKIKETSECIVQILMFDFIKTMQMYGIIAEGGCFTGLKDPQYTDDK